MALQIIDEHKNPRLNKWEVTVRTDCGPRTVIGTTIKDAYALAEREATNPRRPNLVRL